MKEILNSRFPKKKFPKKRISKVVDEICEITKENQYDLIKKEFSKYEYYLIIETNYTTQFYNPFNGHSVMIADKHSGFRVMIGTNKIKSDYLKSNIIIDEIPSSIINFYSKKPKHELIENCILIDINNAYPSALLNNKIISFDTFKFINKLKKIDKLKSIGALATNKFVKEFNYEKLIGYERIPKKHYSVVYFYAAYLIGELMKECEEVAGEDFLMYWFDGIYIKDNQETTNKIINKIKEFNYEYKVIKLDYFKCELIEENKKMQISWLENGNIEPKILNLPKH